MLCWPFISEQLLNKDYICDVWKAVRDETRKLRSFFLIMWRGNAEVLKKKLCDDVKEGGRSFGNFMSFVDWIKSLFLLGNNGLFCNKCWNKQGVRASRFWTREILVTFGPHLFHFT